MNFIRHDGGRAAAGYKGGTSDCATRAIAIASGRSYQQVYNDLNQRAREMTPAADGRRDHARTGVRRRVYEPYLVFDIGAIWTPKMKVGSGCTSHLRIGEFPEVGRFVVSLSHHLCAVIDGAIYDTFNPSRSGQRCVYGWYECPSTGTTS